MRILYGERAMMIGQLVPLADVDNKWSLRFARGDRRCIVTETWGAVWGLVVEDALFAKVVASGHDRNWVANATAVIAGPAVDPDAPAPAVEAPSIRPTASAKPRRIAVLDPDWDEIGVDEVPDLGFTLEPEPEPAYAWR